MSLYVQPWTKLTHIKRVKPVKPVRQGGTEHRVSVFSLCLNLLLRVAHTLTYAQLHTHPLNSDADTSIETTSQADTMRSWARPHYLMRNAANKQIQRKRYVKKNYKSRNLQRACTFVACTITECSKNTGHGPIVMFLSVFM